MTRHASALLFGLLLVAAWPSAVRGQDRQCAIAFVIDGDTVHCGSGEKVRLALIDTPDGGQFGTVARRALVSLLKTGVAYRLEPAAAAPDGAGRTLAYLYLADGRMVNEMILRQGYAFLNPSAEGGQHLARLRAAEQAARGERLGVWSR